MRARLLEAMELRGLLGRFTALSSYMVNGAPGALARRLPRCWPKELREPLEFWYAGQGHPALRYKKVAGVQPICLG
jgi:hypothetical protein